MRRNIFTVINLLLLNHLGAAVFGEPFSRPIVAVSVINETPYYKGSDHVFVDLENWFVNEARVAHRCIDWTRIGTSGDTENQLMLEFTLRFVNEKPQIALSFHLGTEEPEIDELSTIILDNYTLITDVEDLRQKAKNEIKKRLSEEQFVKSVVGDFNIADRVTVHEEHKRVIVPVLRSEYRLKSDSKLLLTAMKAVCSTNTYERRCLTGVLAVEPAGPSVQEVNARVEDLPCCGPNPWAANLKSQLERPGIFISLLQHSHCSSPTQEGCNYLRTDDTLSVTPDK